jgi:hypothetical protein
MRRTKLPWYLRITHPTKGRGSITPRKIGELYAVLALSAKVGTMEAGYLDRDLQAAWAPMAAFDAAQQDATWEGTAKALGI